MITEKDIMVGDWLWFDHCLDTAKEVLYVEGKGMCASFAASATLFPIPLEKISPVELTTEILTKNGYVLKEYGKYLKRCVSIQDDTLVWYPDDGIIEFNGYPVTTCKYVHEFQHAMKIFGIDKPIDLYI